MTFAPLYRSRLSWLGGDCGLCPRQIIAAIAALDPASERGPRSLVCHRVSRGGLKLSAVLRHKTLGLVKVSGQTGTHQREPSRPCRLHRQGRASAKRVTLRLAGAVPAAIAETSWGDTKASDASRRTWRSTFPSCRAMSASDLRWPLTRSSIHARAFAIAASKASRISGCIVVRSPGACIIPFVAFSLDGVHGRMVRGDLFPASDACGSTEDSSCRTVLDHQTSIIADLITIRATWRSISSRSLFGIISPPTSRCWSCWCIPATTVASTSGPGTRTRAPRLVLRP